MKWLSSKECEHYWVGDEKGEKAILRKDWLTEQEECNRLKHLAENKATFYSDYSERSWA